MRRLQMLGCGAKDSIRNPVVLRQAAGYSWRVLGRGRILPNSMEKRGSVTEHLRMAVAAGHIGIWELDVVTGEAWHNAKHDEIFGYSEPLDSWTYDDFLRHVFEEDRSRVEAAFSKSLENREALSFECRIQRSDGMIRWIAVHSRPLKTAEGKNERMIGHVIDITETKRSEEHLKLVTAELNHRLQNIIGTISGLIGLSAREAGDPKEIAKALQSRLAALGRSHNMTFRDRTETVPICMALETEREAMPEIGDRVVIEVDPRLHISAPAPVAERLILVIHELGTNAIKYGALSVPKGRVFIDSQVNDKGEVEILWREVNGPPVKAPSRQGFGTKLLQTALSADASVDIDYGVNGVTCCITFPQAAVTVKS